MNKKCWGCNKQDVSIFAWLAGENTCNECKKQFLDRREKRLCVRCGSSENVFFFGHCEKCNKLKLKKELAWEKSLTTKEEEGRPIKTESKQRADKVLEYGKAAVAIFFGLLFIIALWFQPDFWGFVVGWAIIGGVYLIWFKPWS